MTFEPLIAGFGLFFTASSLLAILAGTLIGLIIGVLPGLGPLMGIILLLPVAYHLEPVAGMGLLISIFVAGSCGGAISAILLRIPGTPLAAATLLDGYPMAQKGEAREALGLAIAASAFGGIIGGIVLVFFSPVLAEFALGFAPPEYFALGVTGLLTIAVVSHEATIKGLITGVFGVLLSTIGYDQFTDIERFQFGLDGLLGGVNMVAVVIGIFAISEIVSQARQGNFNVKPDIAITRPSFGAILHTLRDWWNLLRSSLLGTFFGALPGLGGGSSSFMAYAMARAQSKRPETFGTGNPQGVVATEASNNATVGGTLIPTLALGIPGDASSAVLMGALIILGFFPGPGLFENNLDVVGGIFLSYMSANIYLLVAGVLLTPVFILFIRVRKFMLLPVVALLCVLGVYSISSSIFDLWTALAFGAIGLALRVFNYPLPPIVIGLVLGPICEQNLRRSLTISGGDWSIFTDRPISGTILAINALLILWLCLPRGWKSRMFGRFSPRRPASDPTNTEE
ncbi:tripartite tricarboxylate transporter permease [Martelella sp. UBA3392]|uniref:tripartite tricarboxylate transporter permease n=1 Tax=Martelella sp. UBA3392 TaxID=1946834 RepID=UPI0031F5C3E3|tara:strand:- start:186 stop:1724 length:1539 start_codon:yes stop_codon:yes gene_type:complete